MVRCKQFERISVVAVHDGICQVTYRLQENALHVRAELPPEAQMQPHEKDTEFGDLCAGL